MATALGVDVARVFVSSVYSGSVIVAFAVELALNVAVILTPPCIFN
jgi:hypothetical protein